MSVPATHAAPPPAPESTDSGRDGVTLARPLLARISEDFGFGGQPEGGDAWLGCEVGGARLVKLAGAGGMGRVYEAVQVSPTRRVAVKLAAPESLTGRTPADSAARRICWPRSSTPASPASMPRARNRSPTAARSPSW